MRLHRSFPGSTERAVPETQWKYMTRREELITQIKDEEERIAALAADQRRNEWIDAYRRWAHGK